MGIRVDKLLKKRFTEVAKLKFGSTCNPIESFMAGVVGAYNRDLELGVNPSATVNIGEIYIERNLRERRKLTHMRTQETETEMETVEVVKSAVVPVKAERQTTDWHALSLEDLEKRYNRALACDDVTSKTLCLAELRLRGVSK
jgi:hypothetical protein